MFVPQARLDPLIAAEAAKCLGLQGKESRDAADGLSGGPVVLGVIRGSNARDLAAKVTKSEALLPSVVYPGGFTGVIVFSGGVSARRCSGYTSLDGNWAGENGFPWRILLSYRGHAAR